MDRDDADQYQINPEQAFCPKNAHRLFYFNV